MWDQPHVLLVTCAEVLGGNPAGVPSCTSVHTAAYACCMLDAVSALLTVLVTPPDGVGLYACIAQQADMFTCAVESGTAGMLMLLGSAAGESTMATSQKLPQTADCTCLPASRHAN